MLASTAGASSAVVVSGLTATISTRSEAAALSSLCSNLSHTERAASPRNFANKSDTVRSSWVASRKSGLPSVDSKRIAVMGTSTGGVAATQAALSTPLIKLVIAESAYPDLASVITRQFSMGHWPFSWLAVAYKWTFEMGYRADADAVRMDDTLRSRKDLALLLVNGDQDQLAPWDDLAELVRVAPERTKRVIIPGAGHSACYAAAPELFETVILSFLAQHLSDGRGSGDQTDFATRTNHSTDSY